MLGRGVVAGLNRVAELCPAIVLVLGYYRLVCAPGMGCQGGWEPLDKNKEVLRGWQRHAQLC